jgi:predicted O-methyltransferase YrrM
MSFLKSAYVGGMRGARSVAKATGLLGWLEARRHERPSLWARSLFAIYDIDDMTRLDLPWWTLDAVEKVDSFLRSRPGARVFEYGSGASTIWLARRAASVVSVEHDEAWHPIVAEKLGSYGHARLKLVRPDTTPVDDPRYVSAKPAWRGQTFHDYVHAIDNEAGLFDVIVIDGRARVACLEHAAKRLAPDGLLVFDNTHRTAYRRAIAASGLKALRTNGLTACLPYPDETTLIRLVA